MDFKDFYNAQFSSPIYSPPREAEAHGLFDFVSEFVRRFHLDDKKVLEVGCGRGAFQDLVADYTGTDISEEAGRHLKKPFVACDAANLPFANANFDAVWSIWVLEHTPDPEAVLREIRRVVKPGGFILLRPAWHCRWWTCHGIQVRSYRDLPMRYRAIKALLPLFESRWFRALTVIPRRAVHTFHRPRKLWTSRIPGNFETYWCPDSDAVSYLDPAATALWFEARGDRIVSHPNKWKRIFLASPALIIQRGREDR
jgi:SAM-dependent methyltransferase